MDVDRRRRNIASSFVHMCMVHIHAFSPSPPFFFHSESTDEHVCAIFFFFFFQGMYNADLDMYVCTFSKETQLLCSTNFKKKKKGGKGSITGGGGPPPPHKKKKISFFFYKEK